MGHINSELRTGIMRELAVQSSIDPITEVRRRVDFLKDYLASTPASGFVLGISGGQDSTLTGKLAQQAATELRADGHEAEFVAVRLPYGVQADEDDASIALKFIDPDRTVTVNIKDAADAAAAATAEALGSAGIRDFVRGNIKARQRMVAQYALAGELGYVVVGTDHAAEAITGFFTKFGDGGVDLTPLTGLSKRQGAALLRELGAPESTWRKVPTADLEDDRPALPDEEALGVTYEQIDDYLEGKDVTEEVADKLEKMFLATRHKRTVPVTPFDDWWKRSS
ncbi:MULTISPECIES: ammonia-dependent NAD(+) synthetase [unclassified Rhodococcus (in: high G+C Gram-positive bacteria)]|uniref:ammonia-dependent NAD(+) synthetase n=1 Tax=unclassified Rhodococcus (in: high G+C Gram-positive bacteria) TaxID=192944 RepID=UPI0007BBFC61|nr:MULTISPECIES: ammonia-dependent NAD(+) synthetase [unclassified Rhodococcus (in: high G+C Gram-positive bacteria)]KZF10640.1 NAD(+) synthetase [Rhodococcus sp. EPR-147]KZF11217.1 NAD(+) synthetase [Rhodococcus sp. EPR-279]MDV7987893.1 ammonia-dependent NAD(+) synthetase [Rhodococcus sp. IEGM 1374]OZE26626.1 NAD(+) synthase [Rhodococcus sp. 05-2254-6]OZE31801.1 NAD(+) synthase [Rhodococcus sp. 05-2254-4]